jgi:hypothetical protein|uniref:Helicase ATP-binding domain-containing protein n=1 Tax=viral metagenome TaxID=1070528 RepID=A0A6C0CJQ4_9ZZZZ
MSSSILEKLKVKPIPKKIEKIKVKIDNPQKEEAVVIKTTIIDKTKEKIINREDFIKKLKTAVLTKVPEEKAPEPIVAKKKSKKIGKKLKLVESKEELADSVKIRKTKKPDIKIIADDIDLQLLIGDSKIIDRLPPKEKKILLRANAYYMNNRESFINFINALYKPFKEEFQKASSNLSCDRPEDSQFTLLTHQKVVRDYLNIHSPYRGLLLYHGLGSGKTCSSIAIAEGLKTDKQIIVMTPASLRMNYLQELKSCGDLLYKVNQYWEFIPVNKDSDKGLTDTLSSVLNLSNEYIKKHGGAWLVNVKKKSNFNELTTPQKKSLDLQINEMITHRYRFINYNGLRKSHLRDLTQNGNINPFDNKVIIVDEAHNFVSRIVNKMKDPDSLSMKLYDYLMAAENCRIVFLSGTPIINYPNEVGILFNILRGFIKTWNIPLNIRTARKINRDEMINIFSELQILDYMDYKPASKILTITKNPFGFININKDGVYKGVSNFKVGKRGEISDADFIKLVTAILNKNDIDVISSSIRVENFKALPDTLDSFKNYFINPTNNELMNENLFKRRVLGLTSHFRSATETLMPKFNKDIDLKVLKIPMSDYQFGIYEQARIEERKLETANKKKSRKGDVFNDSVSTYRIFSRAFCNFVFPPENPRPMPQDDKNMKANLDEEINEDILDAIPIREKIQNIDGLYGADDIDILETVEGEQQDDSYPSRIKKALDFLEENKSRYLSKTGLLTYSPKFLNMLENIQEPEFKGLHLIYSQFRTLEGVGILKLILEANGFVQFKIKKNESGLWQLDISDKGKPTFALYTGTEEDEEKEIIRNIYNSDWEKVPSTLVSELSPISTNNFYGEIIKVLMITASGAEGISLKNTRYVHITEPYWHPVRTEQVIGRARRICSHQSLPEALRTVEVFLYLMTFTESQLENEASVQLKITDVSKLDKSLPITSDEALYEISSIKEKINREILKSITESSMDCSLFNKPGTKDAIKCFTFGKTNPNTFSFKPSISNEESDNIGDLNKEKITWKAEEIKIPIDGEKKTFALNRSTMEVFDLESFKQAQEFGSEPVKVGDLIKKADGKVKFVKI